VSILAILGSVSREGSNPQRIRSGLPSGSVPGASVPRDSKMGTKGISASPAFPAPENGLNRSDSEKTLPLGELPLSPQPLLPLEENKSSPGIQPSMTDKYFGGYDNLFQPTPPAPQQQPTVPSALPESLRRETFPPESGRAQP
jgi:hypothetical protein